MRLTESDIEQSALGWLEGTGWRIAHGRDIAPDMLGAERRDYGEVVLAQRLRDALARLNPDLPAEALEDAFRKLTRPERADLSWRNRAPYIGCWWMASRSNTTRRRARFAAHRRR